MIKFLVQWTWKHLQLYRQCVNVPINNVVVDTKLCSERNINVFGIKSDIYGQGKCQHNIITVLRSHVYQSNGGFNVNLDTKALYLKIFLLFKCQIISKLRKTKIFYMSGYKWKPVIRCLCIFNKHVKMAMHLNCQPPH